MDGNRRWARERGLPTFEGHRKGLENTRMITRAVFDAGVETLYYYAFSTENWHRAPEEVSYLMTLFEQAIKNEFAEISKENIRVRFIGDLARLPTKLQQLAKELEEKTAGNTRGTLAIALSYGGRPEIVHAVNALIKGGHEAVTETDIQNALWTKELPDPDLIIRTSGEKRLSNFLTWQSVYSELFFTNTYWPDFSKEELLKIFEEYSTRERRNGK